MNLSIKPENISISRYTATMGMLFAVSAVLNAFESLFSAFLPAGIRIGLSNIVIMAAVISINIPSAFMLTLLKAAFVMLTRGITAGMMSFCGGIAAFAVTVLLFRHTRTSFVFMSVLSALAHIAGQLAAAGILMKTATVFAYAPVLVISSTAAGICTGIVLRTIYPHIGKILKK